MYKYIPSVIIAFIAFAAGYLLHLKLTDPVAAEQLTGDVNRVGSHPEIIDPEEDAALLNGRMNEFVFLTTWINDYASQLNDESLNESLKKLKAVQSLSAKGAKNPNVAYHLLPEQIKACEAFVKAADARLASFEEKDLRLASLRDLMVSYCVQNSYLVGDDDLIGYWASVPAQVSTEEMAYNFGE